MFAVPVLVAIIAILVVIYLVKSITPKPDNFPPGPPNLPIYGSYLQMLKENWYHPQKALLQLTKKYKTDLLGFYMGPLAAATCHKYDLVKEVLTRDEFNGRLPIPIVYDRSRGSLLGVFFTDGDYWKDQRWFALRHLRDFGFGRRDPGIEQTIADEISIAIDLLTSKPKSCDADICTTQGIVKMPDFMYGPALNSVHHSISGRRFDNYHELRLLGKAATKFLHSVDSTGRMYTITPWIRYLIPEYCGYNSAYKDNQVMYDFVQKIINEHKETYCDSNHRDLIDEYLGELKYLREHNKMDTSFSEQQLLLTAVDFMFPSAVGTGHTLSNIFAHFIEQPAIQEKIHEEIDRVVGRSRMPTLDDRKNMPYTEATLREALRKDTLVPLSVPRRATKDTTLGGYFIPNNCAILPNLWAMHNDPEVWGDPENFRPERFLREDGQLAKDISLPFGAGKRLCAGETFARNSMFLFLAGIMQHFTIHQPHGKPKANFKKQSPGLTMTLPDFWIQAVPRN